MILKAYLENENIFHIDILYPLQIKAFFVVKHFL